MMNPRITDYGAYMYCDECANIALEHEWHDDLGMCKACASLTYEEGDNGQEEP